ncbi:HAD family hydrolase [Knoellia sp. Soil729]|uniref:HAD family hydrolase n=1 Tax=Knoellia sp. Soil729 TaxID=1736394 RepID=UPI000ABD6E75|nr:HAD-IA family hydrolase [Knoellia sp. Soil729]
MFKVLLLDLDGVLRLWDPELTTTVELAHGLPPGTLLAAASEPDRLLPALTGAVADEVWRTSVAEAVSAEHGEEGHAAVRDWMAPAGTVNQEVLAVVREARSRLRIVLLTNATSRLGDDLDRLGLADELDGVVSSADLGLAKPDPDVFSQAALANGLMFSEIVFVDRSPASVASAEILGIRSHLYEDAEGMRTFVDEVLSV